MILLFVSIISFVQVTAVTVMQSVLVGMLVFQLLAVILQSVCPLVALLALVLLG